MTFLGLGGKILGMKETWKHKNIFETYLLMGPARTMKELSRQTAVRLATLRLWNKEFNWDSKLAAKDSKVMALIEKENVEVLKNVIRSRHQQAYQKVQEKALKYLDEKGDNFESARDAVVSLDIGVAGERKVLGMNDVKIRGAVAKEGFAAIVECLIGGG